MDEFEKRKKEIQVYMEFLNFAESTPSILANGSQSTDDLKLLRKVLFANTYLLIYNLVESSIRNSIQEIYDHFQDEHICLIYTFHCYLCHDLLLCDCRREACKMSL